MKSKASITLPMTNFYDGQKITEADLDAEQLHNQSVASGIINDFHGSGIVRESIFESNILFDSSAPGVYVATGSTNPSKETIELGNFDGVPLKLDLQPSDQDFGNRLEFELLNAKIGGRVQCKVLVIGFAFSSLSVRGQLVSEVLSFQKNGTLLTKHYYKEVLSIILNNFSGGTGKTELSASKDSLDTITVSGGSLKVKESEPFKVFAKSAIADQIESPNFELNNFITADVGTSIADTLREAIGDDVNFSDLYFELDPARVVSFDKNGSVTKSYGQKFLSKGTNLQRVDLLMSVTPDISLPTDEQLNFSGELVISINKLQVDTTCSSDLVPDRLIDFDPELDPIMEISFSQSDLETLGYSLTEDPQVISFNFASTLLADPNIDPSIVPDEFYAFIISRRGDTTVGTINLDVGFDKPTRKSSNGQLLSPEETFSKQTSRFFEFDTTTKRYVDYSSYSLWHVIHSDCVEVTTGTAYSGDSVLITVPKTEPFVGSTSISKYIDGISLVDVAYGAANYVVLSRVQSFTTPTTHPRTGNLTYTRILDTGEITVYAQALFDTVIADNPLLLAKVIDTNVRSASQIAEDISIPGTFGTDYVIIIDPSTDLLTANLVDRVLTPDVDCECNKKYTIIKAECQNYNVGDINSDGSISSTDISEMVSLLGNTINSNITESSILAGNLDVIKFKQADLNGDNTIDGTDLEILEDAIDGYVNFSVPTSFKTLKIYLQNTFESDDYPVILDDVTITCTTTASSSVVTFTVTDYRVALAIRSADTISLAGSSDTGTFIIASKSLDSTNLVVTLTLENADGSTPSFIGETAVPFSITSGTATNIFADNLKLLELPFAASQVVINFIEAPFSERNITTCDLRRYVSRNFIEEKVSDSCIYSDDSCKTTPDCSPVFKNQQYISGDLYLPDGEIYSLPGVPYHGDFEYATVEVALPPGSIDDCSVDLYNSFIKAESGSVLTAAGYPGMRFSDGTFVGCEDVSGSNDIAKSRVKFSSAIASLYVDSLVQGPIPDGYINSSLDGTSTTSATNIVTEAFTDQTASEFSTWVADPITDTGIFSAALSTDLAVSFTTLYITDTARYGIYEPTTFTDLTGNLLIDFTMARYVWPTTSTMGGVSSATKFNITNSDGTTAELKLGWRQYGTDQVRLFWSGVLRNSSNVITSSFEYFATAPDSVGQDVLFRVRRLNDTFFAYFINPTSISETVDFGQYIRIGGNPSVQPGTGSVSISFESKLETVTAAGLTYQVRLKEIVARSEYSTALLTADQFALSRTIATGDTDRVAMSFPIQITPKTNLLSATLTFTTVSSTLSTDSFNIVPLQIVNADNLSPGYNYPYIQNVSLLTNFMPGALVAGSTFSIDVTNIVTAYLADPGFLPGYYKAFVIEPDAANLSDSSVVFSSTIDLDINYEEITTGVIFKIGISIDTTTGIATFKTKNILYDAMNPANRTTVKFGVYLKKSGFINQDISLGISELKKIGLGSCYDPDLAVTTDEQCYFVVSTTGVGTFIEGPFDCAFSLP
jgi:hypothetical protein